MSLLKYICISIVHYYLIFMIMEICSNFILFHTLFPLLYSFFLYIDIMYTTLGIDLYIKRFIFLPVSFSTYSKYL